MNIFPEPFFTAVLTWELEKKREKSKETAFECKGKLAIIKQNMCRNEYGKEYPFNERTFLI